MSDPKKKWDVVNPYIEVLGMKSREVNDLFEPYRIYLNNAKDAMKNHIKKARWKEIDEVEYRLDLSENTSISEIIPLYQVKIQPNQNQLIEVVNYRYLLKEISIQETFQKFKNDIESANQIKLSSFEDHLDDLHLTAKNLFIFKDTKIYLNFSHIELASYTKLIMNENLIDLLVNKYYQIQLKFAEKPEFFQNGKKIEYQKTNEKDEYIFENLNDNLILFPLHDQYSKIDAKILFEKSFSLTKLDTAKQNYLKNDDHILLFEKKNHKLEPNQYFFKKNENFTKTMFLSSIQIEDLQIASSKANIEGWILDKASNLVMMKQDTSQSYEKISELNEKISISYKKNPSIIFKINLLKKEKWIQLIPKNEYPDEKSTDQKDELDYFFEDDADIVEYIHDEKSNKKNKISYQILDSNVDDKKLLLARKDLSQKNSTYPLSQSKILEVDVNLNNLNKQLDAIDHLKNTPNFFNKIFIDFIDPDQIYHANKEMIDHRIFKKFTINHLQENDWKVLNDKKFLGVEKQRECVEKALSSPDITILDGPPGTGKTTTILELIVQSVNRGEKVLVTASTHAAINNILERIQEKPEVYENVFPLRFGEDIKFKNLAEMSLESLKQSINCSLDSKSDEKILEHLTIASSNLICGTTIGILKLFKDSNDLFFKKGKPYFDIMIIDEASKTTFMEFLVPAIYAKKWVLIGDIRQLSPYTEEEQIEQNLKFLKFRDSDTNEIETLKPSLQKACLYLMLLEKEYDAHKKMGDIDDHKLIIPVKSEEIIEMIKNELDKRKKSTQKEHLNQSYLNQIHLLSDADLQNLSKTNDFYKLYQYSIIFISQKNLNRHLNDLPQDMMIIDPDWMTSAHSFKYNLLKKPNDIDQIKLKVKQYEHWYNLFDHTSWEREISWRLKNNYWQRLVNKANSNKNMEFDRLLPASKDIKKAVTQLKNMAFSSILEDLTVQKPAEDLTDQRKNTLLKYGISENTKNLRYTLLSHQHRMHCDISKFPRENFYANHSLMDGNVHVSREWTYQQYRSRSIWLDVNGESINHSNSTEVMAIMRELDHFDQWLEKEAMLQADPKKKWEVAILTFYKKQEGLLREALKKRYHGGYSIFGSNSKPYKVKLATVDYFQGQEADIVFLSMVNTSKDGFLNSPNRFNVAITRARFQLVIVGKRQYFKNSRSDHLNKIANTLVYEQSPEQKSNQTKTFKHTDKRQQKR